LLDSSSGARQDEAGNATDVIDAYRHGALALLQHRGDFVDIVMIGRSPFLRRIAILQALH
jgi:hypothetical protein